MGYYFICAHESPVSWLSDCGKVLPWQFIITAAPNLVRAHTTTVLFVGGHNRALPILYFLQINFLSGHGKGNIFHASHVHEN